jgi:hypothetical protein
MATQTTPTDQMVGALTTTFAPPGGCLGRDIWQMPNTPLSDSYFLLGTHMVSSCFPKSYDAEKTPGIFARNLPFRIHSGEIPRHLL